MVLNARGRPHIDAVDKAMKVQFADVGIAGKPYETDVLAAAITRRTRAIVPVHLWGQPVEMSPLMALGREHGITVIEDACQAHGAEYRGRRTGNLGDLAAFSFGPSKNLGACGEGGMVTARDPGALALVRRLRDHGQSGRYQHDVIGYSGRLDALQAAILRVKLRALDAANAQRRKLAVRYEEALGDIPGLVLPRHPAHVLPVWHLYVIQVPSATGCKRSWPRPASRPGCTIRPPFICSGPIASSATSPATFRSASSWPRTS